LLSAGGCGDDRAPSLKGLCFPGEKKCVENNLWKCNSAGDGFELLQTCVGGTVCIEFQCAFPPDVSDAAVFDFTQGDVELDIVEPRKVDTHMADGETIAVDIELDNVDVDIGGGEAGAVDIELDIVDVDIGGGETADVPECDPLLCAAELGEAPVCWEWACVEGECKTTPVAEGTACDDGNVCTEGDQCTEGECTGDDLCIVCLTDEDCALLNDDNVCNGTFMCKPVPYPGQCVVDPTSVLFCEPDEDTPCRKNTCNPESGFCEMVNEAEGTPCPGPDICYESWGCNDIGECQGVPVQCDDHNSCTDDICDALSGDCVFVNDDTNECDDEDPETENYCSAGACLVEE